MRPIVIIIAKKKNKKNERVVRRVPALSGYSYMVKTVDATESGPSRDYGTCAENRIKEAAAAAAVLARAVHLVYDRRERSLVYAVVLPGSRATLRSDARVLTIAFHAHIVISNSRTSLISLLLLLS